MWPRTLILLPLLEAACSFDARGLPGGDLASLPDRPAVEARSIDAVPERTIEPGRDARSDRATLDLARTDLARTDLARDARSPDRSPDLHCSAGAARPCYTGPSGTQGKGECKAGSELCTGGAWGACQGEVLPQPETCDGKDNNCNGSPDEGLTKECAYSGSLATKDVGLCRAATQSCSNGSYGQCSGEVLPQTELCDQKDNNCDGKTDEGFSIKCESLACTGTGKIKTIGNLCVDDDGGTTASSDDLEVYCCDGIARFCLSKEACPWRAGCGTPGAATCSHAGMVADFMAKVHCSAWNSHAEYYCTAAGQVYFTK